MVSYIASFLSSRALARALPEVGLPEVLVGRGLVPSMHSFAKVGVCAPSTPVASSTSGTIAMAFAHTAKPTFITMEQSRKKQGRRSILQGIGIGLCAERSLIPVGRASAKEEGVEQAKREAFVKALQAPPDEAEQLWDEAIRLDPANPAAWGNRGAIRLQLQEWQGAFEDFGKTAELEEKKNGNPDAWTLNNLGNAELALGRGEDAVYHFSEASKRNRQLEPIALANLALAQFEVGRVASAISTARAAARRDPSFWDIRAALVAFLWSDPEREMEAEEEWQSLCEEGRRSSSNSGGFLGFATGGGGPSVPSGDETPCDLYKSTDRVQGRWPPRAMAALDAFLNARRSGSSRQFDGSTASYDFSSPSLK